MRLTAPATVATRRCWVVAGVGQHASSTTLVVLQAIHPRWLWFEAYNGCCYLLL